MTVRMSTGLREDLLGHLKDDTFDGAVLYLFGGTQPSSADATEANATTLVIITLGGLSFTPGSQTNGLDFGDITSSSTEKSSTLAKPSAAEWKGTAIASGTITWGRLYSNDRTQGYNAAAIRIDGSASTVSGSDFVVSSVSAVAGVPIVVTQMNLKFVSN